MNAVSDAPRRRTPTEPDPPSAYEMVTRARLEDLIAQVGRLDTKVNALLIAALTTLVAELLRASVR